MLALDLIARGLYGAELTGVDGTVDLSRGVLADYRIAADIGCDLGSDPKGISAENLEVRFTLRKFQVMPENGRKFSRYDRQEFHLMT
jgi:hypothetical protein